VSFVLFFGLFFERHAAHGAFARLLFMHFRVHRTDIASMRMVVLILSFPAAACCHRRERDPKGEKRAEKELLDQGHRNPLGGRIHREQWTFVGGGVNTSLRQGEDTSATEKFEKT
jgi:hypothetical protein